MPALNTLQSVIDAQSAAYMADDWDSFISTVELPMALVAANGAVVAEGHRDLRAGYRMYVSSCHGVPGIRLERIVEWAAFLGDTMVAGVHVTHLLSGATHVIPPYRSQMTLRLRNGVWRTVAVAIPLQLPLRPLREQIVPDTPLYPSERLSE